MIRNDRLLILGPARSWLCRRRLCKRIVVFRLVPHLRISFIDVFTYFQVCMYNCRNSNSKVVVVVRIYPKFAVNIVFCECNSVFFIAASYKASSQLYRRRSYSSKHIFAATSNIFVFRTFLFPFCVSAVCTASKIYD